VAPSALPRNIPIGTCVCLAQSSHVKLYLVLFQGWRDIVASDWATFIPRRDAPARIRSGHAKTGTFVLRRASMDAPVMLLLRVLLPRPLRQEQALVV
jgi:hypothetical protein